MIRILHVVTYMGRGGLETVLMNYYRNIDRTKIQFDFLTHRDFRADYDDEIESLGGRIYRIPRLVPWSSTYIKALDIFFKDHPEYKIVHVHQDCLSSCILKVAKYNNVPVRIAHSHANSQDKNFKYLIKLFYRRQIPQYSTELFACSKSAGDWMFRGANFTVLHNAIEARKYAFNKETAIDIQKLFSIPNDAFVVGHVGRFAPAKNHAFLIDIFAKIKLKKNNAVLLLVGDGELKNDIMEKVERLGLSDSVIFTGLRPDIYNMVQAMDIFVMPSNYEGLGLAIIEAQASGLHCIVSDNVSEECQVTDLVSFYSLSKSADEWADLIISKFNETRPDTLDSIIDSGYNIQENALWLQNHYIKLWEEN